MTTVSRAARDPMVACLPSKGPLESQLMGPAMETDDRSMKGRWNSCLGSPSSRTCLSLTLKQKDLGHWFHTIVHRLHLTSTHPTARTVHAMALDRPSTKAPRELWDRNQTRLGLPTMVRSCAEAGNKYLLLGVWTQDR